MNNLEKWLISIEPEKVIEEIQKRACSECPAAEYCKKKPCLPQPQVAVS